MAPPSLALPHNSVAPAHSCPKLRPVTRTSLLSVFLGVALAVMGCNRKPAAPTEEQPVADQQRLPREQTPQQASVAQQTSDLLQAPVRPLQAPVPPPESAASPLPLEIEKPPPQAPASPQQVAGPPQASTPSSIESTPTPEPLKSPEAPQDPLAARLGLFIPLTGSQASFGIDALNGARLAVDEINEQGGVLDHPVNLITKDTESRTELVASIVGELIDTEKVVALIGEITTDRTLAAAPLAQERGIPLITPSATNEKITAAGNYVFRACYTDAFQAAIMTKFARSLDVEKVAMLFDGENPYGASLSNAFKVDFVKQGGSIVAEQTYRAGDVDYATQLNAIKQKNPDIVFLPSYFAEAAVIIKQARQLAIEVPFLGTDGWDSSELLKFAGQAVNNCYFASHFSSELLSDRAKPFGEAYRTKFQAAPPPLAALTYDAVWLLADALRRGGSNTSTALRDALAETKDFAGVTGTIAFDQDRNPKKPGIILRIQDGRFSYLETVEP